MKNKGQLKHFEGRKVLPNTKERKVKNKPEALLGKKGDIRDREVLLGKKTGF